MRRLLTARAHAVRLDALRRALREPARSGRSSLLVAPSRGAADEVLRGDLELETALGVHRAGFQGLALDLAVLELARAGEAPTGALAREALAARALAEVGSDLAHFAPIANTPGLPRALARTLDDLRRFGLPLERVAEAGPAGPDLARLLRAHAALLEDRGLADDARVLAAAARALRGERPHRLAGRPLYLLDVAPRDPAEAELVRALADASTEAVAVLEPTDPDLAPLAEALGVEPTPLDEPEPTDALGRARARVFEDAGPPTPPDETLRFFSAPGEARECVEIARGILRWARAGTPFDRIGVLLRDPERYQPHLTDAFARAEIPACFTRAVRQPDPAGRALLALLACAAEDLSAARFAEYLSLGEVPRPDPEGAPPAKPVPWVAPRDDRQLVFFSLEPEPTGEPPAEPLPADPAASPVTDGRLRAPYRWEKLLVDAAVVGGRDRWARRLAGLRDELETQARALASEHPQRAEKKRADLVDLGHLERFALPLVEKLAALPRRGRWGTWLEALEGLAGAALRAPERVLRVLAELRVMSEVGPVELEEVRIVLQERLGFLREEDPDPEPYGRVWVGSLDEAAGRAFEAVFLPGLADGVFPRPASEDPLLLDPERAGLDPRLPRRPRAAAEERARLRRALGAATLGLEASYPRLDTGRGRPRALSFYALDLVRAAEGALPPVRELERRATEAAAAYLGWSAPIGPDRAIDAAEYDLAVLAERLRALPPGAAAPDILQGAGRYLVDGADGPPNPHLARALHARAARWRSRLGPHDGYWGAEDGQLDSALLGEHLDARPYSASHLAHFSACPYRFYLAALVRLRPRELPVRIERMDPLIRGNLAHAALFDWVQRLRAADLLPWAPDDLPVLLDHLRSAVRGAADRFEERLAPAIPSVWRREVDRIERDLRAWVRREIQDPTGFAPLHAELAFGLGADRESADPASTPDPVRLDGGYLLRGSIDLVEADPRGALRVTDYKTGKRTPPDRSVEAVRGGTVLQPLLYAAAAERLLEARVDCGRLAFVTARGGLQSDWFPNGPEARGHLRAVLEGVADALRRGWLPALPGKDACKWCDYRPVCGTTEELRAGRAKGERAPGPLLRLRSLP